jgi:hypothetical protein
MMKIGIWSTLIFAATSALWCQEQGSAKSALQARVAELKASVAANQANLKKYQWLQTTQVSIKGETKKEEQAQCRYGPDGKLQKTPVGAPPEPKAPPKGLKGKVVAKKVEELKDYTDRLKSLVSHYAPPDPQRMQAAAQAGNANLNISEDNTTLTFTDYYKPGDKVAFAFDTTAKKLKSYDVNTYLDDPKKDIVTLTNQFASLPDGTNYLEQTVLDATGKQIQIKTTNSGHSLVGP